MFQAPFSTAGLSVVVSQLVAARKAFRTSDERALSARRACHVLRFAIVAFGVAVACVAHRVLLHTAWPSWPASWFACTLPHATFRLTERAPNVSSSMRKIADQLSKTEVRAWAMLLAEQAIAQARREETARRKARDAPNAGMCETRDVAGGLRTPLFGAFLHTISAFWHVKQEA